MPALALLPFTLMSIYVVLGRSLGYSPGRGDWIVLAAIVALSTALVAFLPLKAYYRVTVAVLYALCMCYLLFWYAFTFIGYIYDDWL